MEKGYISMMLMTAFVVMLATLGGVAAAYSIASSQSDGASVAVSLNPFISDGDKNGVDDEVQRFIDLNNPRPDVLRNALYQVAVSTEVYANTLDSRTLKREQGLMRLSTECVISMLGTDKGIKAISSVKRKVLDSDAKFWKYQDAESSVVERERVSIKKSDWTFSCQMVPDRIIS